MNPNKLLILLFLSLIFQARAQWSTDPSNPGVVCNLPGQQSSVRAFSDGNEGAYVLWLDARSGAMREVYGQHFDENGYPQWETNGRLIVSHSSLITSFTAARYENGDILIGWMTQSATLNLPDTLLIQKLGADGEKLWSSDLVAASVAEPAPFNIAYLNSFGFAPVNDNYSVFLRVAYGFGFNGNRYSYFNADGGMEGPVNGYPIGPQSSYGSSGFLTAFDGSGDIILYYSTGNGMGAPLMVVRADDGGVVKWGPVAATEGSTGLNYNFTGGSDEGGAILFWQGSGTNGSVDYFMRRVNNDGSFGWGGGIHILCGAEGTQANLSIRRTGSTYYAAWADARPGVSPGWYDIYMQKLDTAGAFHWAQDGIEVASFNTYDPHTRLTLDAEGNIVLVYQSNVTGYIGQKITPDGQLPWGPEAMLVTNTTLMPAHVDHTIFASGDNTIAAWASSSGNASDIYISRVDEVIYANVPSLSSGSFTVGPNPASEKITVTIPAGTASGEINLFNASGKLVRKTQFDQKSGHSTVTFNINDLPAGFYFLRLTTGRESWESKVIISMP
jgi:hypothetical protein